MQIALFYHSLLSCWNNGNAHFLRGIASELICRGHRVRVFEPAHSWSLTNLVKEQGYWPVDGFRHMYPGLESTLYDLDSLDVQNELEDCDLVIVHEWNQPALVQKIGEDRAAGAGYRLLFHDTHHRSVTDHAAIDSLGLRNYDGILAYGAVLRDLYLAEGWTDHAWTWHEAADTNIFRPLPAPEQRGDLVWIGNWGDEERTAELQEFLIEPVRQLGIRVRAYGVRYPQLAQDKLAQAGIEYCGWLPNYDVPRVFAAHKLTIHVPRRPYVDALPGIPTIRPFEALACGIPLISSPWHDTEGLFTEGKDYLMAHDGKQMLDLIRELLEHPESARVMAEHGRRTVLRRHTCPHRVTQLLHIYAELQGTEENKAAIA